MSKDLQRVSLPRTDLEELERKAQAFDDLNTDNLIKSFVEITHEGKILYLDLANVEGITTVKVEDASGRIHTFSRSDGDRPVKKYFPSRR
jgi:hypothetical protein